jgi:hypothetical protein
MVNDLRKRLDIQREVVLKDNLAGDLGFSTGSLAQTNVCATIYEQLQTQAI